MNEKTKLEVTGNDKRRVSILSLASDAGSDYESKKNIKYGKPLAALWGMWEDFTNNSTVHGVKYLGEKKRHWSERSFWVIFR